MTRAIAIALSGCSFALVRAPGWTPTREEPEPRTWPRCTEHYFWALADGAITALAMSGFVYFLDSDSEAREVGLIVEGGLAFGFGISALSGLGKTGRCREARRLYEKAADEGR